MFQSLCKEEGERSGILPNSGQPSSLLTRGATSPASALVYAAHIPLKSPSSRKFLLTLNSIFPSPAGSQSCPAVLEDLVFSLTFYTVFKDEQDIFKKN